LKVENGMSTDSLMKYDRIVIGMSQYKPGHSFHEEEYMVLTVGRQVDHEE